MFIYEIELSRVEIIEKKCSFLIRKWHGLPCVENNSALYREKGTLKLPVISIVKSYKAEKVRIVMILKELRDPEMRKNP